MIFYSCTNITPLSKPEEAMSIVKSTRFMSIVWHAATFRPLNRRTVGGLEEKRQKIIGGTKEVEGLLSVPIWWKELISKG